MNRRSFIQDIALGFYAMVFTSSIVIPSWGDTLRVNRKEPVFVPHWAQYRQEWFDWKCRMNMPAEQNQWNRYNNSVICTSDDFVYLGNPTDQEMVDTVKTPGGIEVNALVHFPVGFVPPNRTNWRIQKSHPSNLSK